MQPQQSPPQETPQEPKVSVIIATWNSIEALRRSLTALNASRGRDQFEVLVIDLGSRDGCGQVDAEFPNVTFLRLPRNFGRTRARNIGMRTALAELVLLLAPEAEVAPQTVMALAAAVEADEHAVAALPRLLDAAGQPLPLGAKLPDRKALAAACKANRDLPLGPAVGTAESGSDAALLIRKSFLRGMNYFDEKRFSEYWVELELFWQIRNAGKRVLVVETPVTLHAPRPSVQVPRSEQALLAADRIAAAASYLGKHDGFLAMLGFLLGQLAGALGMIFREPGYGLRLAFGILSGARVDGTQGGVLG
ncbi:MAG: glycosyltransferase [Bryobacteraceae bacterium]